MGMLHHSKPQTTHGRTVIPQRAGAPGAISDTCRVKKTWNNGYCH